MYTNLDIRLKKKKTESLTVKSFQCPKLLQVTATEDTSSHSHPWGQSRGGDLGHQCLLSSYSEPL